MPVMPSTAPGTQRPPCTWPECPRPAAFAYTDRRTGRAMWKRRCWFHMRRDAHTRPVPVTRHRAPATATTQPTPPPRPHVRRRPTTAPSVTWATVTPAARAVVRAAVATDRSAFDLAHDPVFDTVVPTRIVAAWMRALQTHTRPRP